MSTLLGGGVKVGGSLITSGSGIFLAAFVGDAGKAPTASA